MDVVWLESKALIFYLEKLQQQPAPLDVCLVAQLSLPTILLLLAFYFLVVDLLSMLLDLPCFYPLTLVHMSWAVLYCCWTYYS